MLKLIHPFTMLVSGPTQAGKTAFVVRMIQNSTDMIDPLPQKIIYCYREYQPVFSTLLSKVQFYSGLPSLEFFDGRQPTLLIIDDLLKDLNESVAELFTTISHHRSVSVVFLTQNLFPKNPHARTMSLNSQYIVLFKNPRDGGQVESLARQIFGRKRYLFVLDAFFDATRQPHSYLLLDLKPQMEDRFRVRTAVFPGEQSYVYVDRHSYRPDLQVLPDISQQSFMSSVL